MFTERYGSGTQSAPLPAEQAEQPGPQRRPAQQIVAFAILRRLGVDRIGVRLLGTGLAYQLPERQQLRTRLVRVANVEFDQTSRTMVGAGPYVSNPQVGVAISIVPSTFPTKPLR